MNTQSPKDGTIERLAIILICALLGISVSEAGSLRMNYAEVFIENLQLGATYNMTEVANLPLRIRNKHDEPIDLEVKIACPGPSDVKDGFESVPDEAWIGLSGRMVHIEPHEVAELDVQIAVPDAEAFLGRRFHAQIVLASAREDNSPSLSMGIVGRLLFSVAPERQALDTEKPDVDLSFNVEPAIVEMENVALGKKVEILIPSGEEIGLANHADGMKSFSIGSIDPGQSVLALVPGYEPCPDPDFVSMGEERVTVPGNARKPLRMFVQFPKDPLYAGQRYAFIVAVRTGSGDQVQGQRYLQIYITTANADEADKSS